MITNAPYLLIPITAGLLILYFISLLFSHLEILSSKLHRQIWNYALLLTFLVTIVLGILMAIQINYKLEVPWTEKVLRWHVNFGIGMSLTGLFHLSWHFLYFVPFTKQLTTSEDPFPTDNKSLTGIHINNINFVSIPLVIGFSAILVQTVMIRELLALFQGNELTLSIIFLLWMAITGAGSITGSVARVSDQLGKTKSSAKVILLIRTLIFLPLVLMPLLYLLKKQFFAPGIEAGPLPFTALTCIILLPYCFLSGFAFTWSARVFQPDGSRLRHFYGWESAGGAIGGLIVTLTILLGMSSITVLFLGAAAVTLLLTILSKQNKTSGLILTVIVLAIGVSVHSVDLDRVITRMFHPNETVLAPDLEPPDELPLRKQVARRISTRTVCWYIRRAISSSMRRSPRSLLLSSTSQLISSLSGDYFPESKKLWRNFHPDQLISSLLIPILLNRQNISDYLRQGIRSGRSERPLPIGSGMQTKSMMPS